MDLVSCMLVTRPSPSRWVHVKRSIACFARQTHSNRELVVVLDAAPEEDRRRFEENVASLEVDHVRVVRGPDEPTLGRLRNLAIAVARGDFLCVWDDDDIHHPERIERQMVALRDSGAIATFLSDVLHFFAKSSELFCTSYKRTPFRCLPGTGLFRRTVAARYPESGPQSHRAEDTAFFDALTTEGAVHIDDAAPHLYVYTSHGENTSGDAHHTNLAATLALSRALVERRRALVVDALERADLDVESVRVMGHNGEAFVWQRKATDGVR